MGIVNSKLMVFFWIYVHGFRGCHKIFSRKVHVKEVVAVFRDVFDDVLKGIAGILWLLLVPAIWLLSPIWMPIVWLIAPIPEAWRCTFRPKDKRILAESIEKIKRGEY